MSGGRPIGRPAKNPTQVLQRERHQPDYMILVVVVALSAIGILMVYSSSAMRGYLSADDTFATVGPQIQWALLGVDRDGRDDARRLSLPAPRVGARSWRLALVLLAGRSSSWVRSNDRRRRLGALAASWARCRPSTRPRSPSSPSSIYLAHWFAKRGTKVHGFWGGTVPFLIILAPIAILVFKEPDLGTTIGHHPDRAA